MGRRKDQAQFNMRLSKPLLKRLQIAAKDQDRSVNSEMVHRLEQSFAQGTVAQLNATARAFLDLAAQKLASENRPPEAREVLRKLTEEQRARGKLAQPRPVSDQEPELPSFLSSLEKLGPGPYANETNEERRVRLHAMAEDIRKNADAHDARGAHDMAARAREMADELERDEHRGNPRSRLRGARTAEQPPQDLKLSDIPRRRTGGCEEGELPMPQPRGRRAK